MASCIGIARFDHEGQAAEDDFGGIEIIGEALETHQRSDARAHLGTVHRFRQKVIRAGFDGPEPIVALGRACQQDHWESVVSPD